MPELFTDAAAHGPLRRRAALRRHPPRPAAAQGHADLYAAHLLAVASLALEMHGDEDEAIGALLHDAHSILTDYRAHGDALWARFGQGKGLATRVY